jgi:hypothetical protein
MNVCEDKSAFEWIENGRLPMVPSNSNDFEWKGNIVQNCLPDQFEAYAKILHRIEANYRHIDNPLSPEEIAILQITACTLLRSFVELSRTPDTTVRLRWKNVAKFLNVPYSPEINDEWFRKRLEPGCWPRFIKGPDDGFIGDSEYMELVSLLSDGGNSNRCYFRLPEIAFIATDHPLLYEGPIEEITNVPGEPTWSTPEYCWPSSYEWCVCSDWDLTFTLVGGARKTIDRILQSSILEAIEVRPEHRVDIFAPMPLA